MRRSLVPSERLISLFVLLGLALCPSVSAQFNPVQAAKDAYNLEDRALLRREVTAYAEAQRAQDQKQQQQELNKAKQAKPNL